MKIRTMNREDLPQVEGIQKSITRNPVSDHWRDMLAKHVDSADSVGFVAEDKDNVIGFIIGETKVGEFGTEVCGWLEMVGVLPEKMGQGTGRALAKHLVDYFSSMGVSDINTAVLWDSGDMLAFFKSLGFDRSPFINLQLNTTKNK